MEMDKYGAQVSLVGTLGAGVCVYLLTVLWHLSWKAVPDSASLPV